jgi:hypothetical protein
MGGDDVHDHNRQQAKGRALYREVFASYGRLFEELQGHLTKKHLIAFGRRESPLAAAQAIPPTAWKVLKLLDPRSSRVRETTSAKTQIFDVRIFPVVEAPDAVNHLSGLTLVEALHQFVFGDPQWGQLCASADSKGDKVLKPTHEHLLYAALWPADCGRSDWAETLFYLNSHPGSAGHLADLVVGRRFSRLINYLASGELIAEGTTKDGKTVAVPRSLWVRRQTHIDVMNGDLIEYRENARERWEWYSEPIYKGIIVRKAEEMFLVKPTVSDGVPPATIHRSDTPPSKATTRVHATVRSQRECRNWLAEIMRSSPKERKESNEALWSQAQQQWPNSLSRRAFDKAKSEAIESTGASAWGASGRPRKSPRANRRAD